VSKDEFVPVLFERISVGTDRSGGLSLFPSELASEENMILHYYA
jgi:hypothetical protein